MSFATRSRKRRDAQTLVFFILAFGTIILLCGLAIDSGLLYLAKAKMGRAVDGAALAAVGNFNQSPIPATNRDLVATTMRNFATANYTDLSTISTTGSTTPGGTSSGGTTNLTYTYNFNDGTQDANGQYKRFVQVVLTTGAGGGITSASCNARCPVHTYFIGYAGSFFKDLKVSSSAVATRNPRLIMIVVDRSASMLSDGGGAYGLPQAVTQFLDFFDTSSDYIGIVSFGSTARLEMPLTTNFIQAGTNVLYDSYQLDSNESAYSSVSGSTYSPVGVPGGDPEEFSSNADYDIDYATMGVRRLKFGGQTAADEGIRLGMEQMMANPGFNDPDVVKYMVLFTDGAWNTVRTLLAAPGYTNEIDFDTNTFLTPYAIVTNTSNPVWTQTTNMAVNTNVLPVPTLSPMPGVTNAIGVGFANTDFGPLAAAHTYDYSQSVAAQDAGSSEPLFPGHNTPNSALEGAPMLFKTNTYLGTYAGKNNYARNIDVWLQPGAVNYHYNSNGVLVNLPMVSSFVTPTQHVTVTMQQGDRNVLVVPGYVVDGTVYDKLDMGYPDNSDYPYYNYNNFSLPFTWPDETSAGLSTAAKITAMYYGTTVTGSLERQLMFRNYMNLLTGYYVFRPDEPLETYVPGNPTESQGIEPLDDTSPVTQRPLYGLGPYYPSAGFYWPFDMVGIDSFPTFGLTNAIKDPDLTHEGFARHIAYSINMSNTNNVTPEWAGEWFFEGTGGTNSVSGTGTSSVSTLISSQAEWENGAPDWLKNDFDYSGEGVMTNEAAHNTNLAVSVWRPYTFAGNQEFNTDSSTTVSQSDSANHTGGYVSDGNNHYFKNAMAWSGRPTHYFDFSTSKWVPIPSNHVPGTFLPLGNWKAQEYAWHARNLGVTIYTVGYGFLVSPSEQVLLAQIANSTNTTAGNPQSSIPFSYTAGPGTAISYNPGQPIGQQFFATNAADISNDFFQVGQAINAALTQ